MLEHIYGKEYKPSTDVTGLSSDEKLTEIIFHAQICIAADKYDVPSLREDIAAKFEQQLHDLSRFNLDSKHLPRMIKLVVSHVGDGALKKHLIPFCEKWMEDLVQEDGFISLFSDATIFEELRVMENISYAKLIRLMQDKTFLDVLDATPALSKGLLLTIVAKIQPDTHIRKCSACGRHTKASRCICRDSRGIANNLKSVGCLLQD